MKRIIQLLLFFGLVMILCGCPAEEIKPNPNVQSKQQIYFEIYYFKDTRTDLCFAWTGNSHSLTKVECTDKVLSLVK